MSRLNRRLIKLLPVLLILFLGAFLRFYKLNWGENYFFHPDEYHISAAVERISFPSNLNPHLFSYGSFTVYLIYFSRVFVTVFSKNFQNFPPFLIGRFYSALFSTLTIVIIYLIGKRLFKNKVFVLISAALVSLMPGLIQQAHFATPESTLTFFLTLSIYLWLRWIDERKVWVLVLSAVSLGFASATKITGVFILPILFIMPFIKDGISKKDFSKKLRLSFSSLAFFFMALFFAFPYAFLDFRSFRNSMTYEGSVAAGRLLVFYTRQFIDTRPFIFQFTKILPYALGWGVLITSMLGLIFLLIHVFTNSLKRLSIDHKPIILLLSFILLFVPNSLLFAKWTRFINPTFVFFGLFAVYFIQEISNFLKTTKHKKLLLNILALAIVIPTFIWTLMFFSIYTNKDVRITASNWVNSNVPKDSFILSETGNTLEVPLRGGYKKIAFDFYNLDSNPQLQNQLIQYLSSSDYFIIQSRRIFMNEQGLPNQFPITSNFYNLLFSEKLGFEEIAKFESFPKLEIGNWKLEIDDEGAEETWSVFDHPVIRIYKKVAPLSREGYANLIQI